MRPTIIPDYTRRMVQPDNWDPEQGKVVPLHVRDELDAGIHVMRSAWEPEGEEAGWLLAGGHLHLQIAGKAHPVIAMSVQLPPEDSPPVIIARQIVKEPGVTLAMRVDMYFPPQPGSVAFARHGWAEIELTGRSLAQAIADGVIAIEAMMAHAPPLLHGEESG